MLRDGMLNFHWIQVNNNLQAAPNNSQETYPGYRNPENFILVSDAYPTVTAMAADVILPAAMWVIARKMQASKEVWGKIFGTIGTRRKFLDKRLELAQHEWARLKANDSLECRNCHSSVAMDLSRQTPRAAEIHTRYLLPGEATSTATRASPMNCRTWKGWAPAGAFRRSCAAGNCRRHPPSTCWRHGRAPGCTP
jgi:hypothetical protein